MSTESPEPSHSPPDAPLYRHHPRAARCSQKIPLEPPYRSWMTPSALATTSRYRLPGTRTLRRTNPAPTPGSDAAAVLPPDRPIAQQRGQCECSTHDPLSVGTPG